MRARTQPTISPNNQRVIECQEHSRHSTNYLLNEWLKLWFRTKFANAECLLESVGTSEGLSWARSQRSSTVLLFNTLSLHCILRRWNIKIKLLDQAQNLHSYAKMKCSFLAGKNVQICHRISSNLELAWMNCINEMIMVPSPHPFVPV